MKISECAAVTIWLIENTQEQSPMRFEVSLHRPPAEWRSRHPHHRIHEREFVIPDMSKEREG